MGAMICWLLGSNRYGVKRKSYSRLLSVGYNQRVCQNRARIPEVPTSLDPTLEIDLPLALVSFFSYGELSGDKMAAMIRDLASASQREGLHS
jgi:hypothetical protein